MTKIQAVEYMSKILNMRNVSNRQAFIFWQNMDFDCAVIFRVWPKRTITVQVFAKSGSALQSAQATFANWEPDKACSKMGRQPHKGAIGGYAVVYDTGVNWETLDEKGCLRVAAVAKAVADRIAMTAQATSA